MASFITGDSDHVSQMESTFHSELYDDQNSEDEDQQEYSSDGYLTDDD